MAGLIIILGTFALFPQEFPPVPSAKSAAVPALQPRYCTESGHRLPAAAAIAGRAISKYLPAVPHRSDTPVPVPEAVAPARDITPDAARQSISGFPLPLETITAVQLPAKSSATGCPPNHSSRRYRSDNVFPFPGNAVIRPSIASRSLPIVLNRPALPWPPAARRWKFPKENRPPERTLENPFSRCPPTLPPHGQFDRTTIEPSPISTFFPLSA